MRTVTVIHGETIMTVRLTVINIPELETLETTIQEEGIKLRDVLFVFDGDVKPILLD